MEWPSTEWHRMTCYGQAWHIMTRYGMGMTYNGMAYNSTA